MAEQRHYRDKIMLSLFDKEATYDAGPSGWTSSSACEMIDHDDASGHPTWDDHVQNDSDVVTGAEGIKRQLIARQSMRVTYTEPHTKPNTMAGLLGLTLGTIVSTQDGANVAYRHRISPSGSISLPSIGGQFLAENGVQRKYTGIKSDEITLALNADFVRLSANLVGSGTRTTAADAFPAAIDEAWLLSGNSKLYIKDTGGTPISTVLATPSQTAPNLGGSEVQLSSRTLECSIQWMNAHATDAGYRPGTGLVRQNFHPVRRHGQMVLKFETAAGDEAALFDHYFAQHQLAFEFNLNSAVAIGGGTFFYGAIIIIPRIQLMPIPRSQTNELEDMTYTGEIMDDGTNPRMLAFVYNAQAAYLV